MRGRRGEVWPSAVSPSGRGGSARLLARRPLVGFHGTRPGAHLGRLHVGFMQHVIDFLFAVAAAVAAAVVGVVVAFNA